METNPPAPAKSSALQGLEATEGHTAAREHLLKIGELYFSGTHCLPSGLQLRFFPLVLGPTGVGKTHLVRGVASRLRATYLRLSRSEWLVQGCSRGRPTLYSVIDELSVCTKLVVHLDELDKMQMGFSSNDWGAAVAGDLWNLLDRLLPVTDYLRDTTFPGGEPPTPMEIKSWIRNRLWIVGSGTWQRVFAENRAGGRVGFLSSTAEAPVTAHTIAQSELISPELLHRFSSDLVFLKYPNRAETARLLESTGINALARQVRETIDPASIDWNHGGLRVLETLATRLVIAREDHARAVETLVASEEEDFLDPADPAETPSMF